MATLRIRDLEKGGVYREVLSGYKVQVRLVATGDGGPHYAHVRYYNSVTGRFGKMNVYDGELEEIIPKNDE